MLPFLVRLLFLAAAGVVLYRLWKVTATEDRLLRLVVLVGFLARAIFSQGLFWISWLSLPLAKSMQIGHGLWFFATDARIYTRSAAAAAHGGLDAIATIAITEPSVTYMQALSLFSFAFGDAVAVSLLLNLFCYLGACAIIVRWSAQVPGSRNAALIALAAISLSPAGMLWSLQPLKDTFIQFLIVAFAGACYLWQRAWRTDRYAAKIIGAAAAMIVTFYLASGVRWYVGMVLFSIAAIFLVLVAATLHGKRWPAVVSSLVVILLLARTLVFIAGPYLPVPVQKTLAFHFTAVKEVPKSMAEIIERSREGFVRTGGNTSIHRPVVAHRAKPPVHKPVAAIAPPPAMVVTPPPVQKPVVAAPSPQPKKSKPVKKAAPAPVKPAPAPVTAAPVTPAPVKPAPKPVVKATPAPPPAVAKEIEAESDSSVVPTDSLLGRFVAGAAATALPRAIASRLHLVEIGGGRSLWWFVEIDTLVFDAVLLIALWMIVVNFRRGSVRNGVFWLVAGMTLLLGASLVYTVTNFGTLFRLRAMIYTGMALIPLALMTAPRREEAAAGEPVRGILGAQPENGT